MDLCVLLRSFAIIFTTQPHQSLPSFNLKENICSEFERDHKVSIANQEDMIFSHQVLPMVSLSRSNAVNSRHLDCSIDTQINKRGVPKLLNIIDDDDVRVKIDHSVNARLEYVSQGGFRSIKEKATIFEHLVRSCTSLFFMGIPEGMCSDFEQKLRRTVFLDDLSPQVTAAVIKTALEQFGKVIDVQFIPNYIGPRNIPQCALVELENAKQARGIVEEMTNFPFMMSGMPRPLRARAAQKRMFGDHPKKPGVHIRCRWVDPMDPNFEVARELKDLTKIHAEEASFLLKLQLEDEDKLMKNQKEVLEANYKKFEMIDSVVADKTLTDLASRYGMRMKDD
ncbi:hypothetical protein NE237_023915 [Protea cynaroides]|uniref:RRM domain-containing protein n=1 Tax=Protea cynaroides TaxID=273540 RepID=A0A9Q0K5M6_9MAGN|nr:hypothetical protein NE237_023915 [Protea cynaroides]